MSFLDKMKKAGKSVVDAGAKTMLKVRILPCQRECFPGSHSPRLDECAQLYTAVNDWIAESTRHEVVAVSKG